MKIHFMKDEALTYFKQNIQDNLLNYLSKDNSWVIDKYAKHKGEDASPFSEFKLDIPEFAMDMSQRKPENTDVNNAKILYTALKNISDTQATDERFWVGLAHSDLWEYMQYRCKFYHANADESKVLGNYFFKYGQKRSLIMHPLARLWWVGRLVYCETSQDHFAGIEYFNKDFGGNVLTMFSNSYTNNPVIVRSLLKSIVFLEEKGENINTAKFRELLRYINFLGGIIILDYLSEEDLIQKITNHYCETYDICI